MIKLLCHEARGSNVRESEGGWGREAAARREAEEVEDKVEAWRGPPNIEGAILLLS